MPSSYDGPSSSGVGDNSFGKYWAGSRRSGGGMFSNNRQMKQYMQMKRDEMSHGAFLQNQLNQSDFERNQQASDSEFNRTSLRENAANEVNDWQKSRNTFHTGEVRKTDPNITGYKTDGPSFSFTAEPGLHATGRAAQERFQEMKDTGSPLVTPPSGPAGPARPSRPASVQSTRVQPAIGGGDSRLALPAPAGGPKPKAPRGKREPGWQQQTLPGMRNTRQFKDTTISPSTGSPATSTPIKSGNEINEVTGPKNAAGTGRTDLPTKFF